jgi:hypothetical protein
MIRCNVVAYNMTTNTAVASLDTDLTERLLEHFLHQTMALVDAFRRVDWIVLISYAVCQPIEHLLLPSEGR